MTAELQLGPPEGASTAPVLKLLRISKRFGAVQALSDVDAEFRAGRIHALLGENGAGKSTLLNVIDGAVQPDSGEMLIDGSPVSFSDPRAAMDHGISMVHQELSILPQLTLAENVVLGHERRAFGVIDRRYTRREAKRCMAMLGYDQTLAVAADRVSVATRQITEIARALFNDRRVLILDEPTASLSPPEVQRLMQILRRLCAEGKTIVFVSHRLTEVIELQADDVTVLRDGAVSARFTWDAGYSQDDLVRAMVGRSVEVKPLPPRSIGQERLRVEELAMSDTAPRVSLTVRGGEIVGLAGMVGSGRSGILRGIAGAQRRASGRVFVDDVELKGQTPRDAIRAGIAMLTEDRRSLGLVAHISIAQNVTLPHPPSRGGVIQRRLQHKVAAEAAGAVGLERHPSTVVAALSGGNQQKVVLARWVLTGAGVFLFDEPTRGVDVGAKDEIHQLIRRLAESGAAILVVSSELVELMALADRILVMRRGEVVSTYPKGSATEEKILHDAASSIDVHHA